MTGNTFGLCVLERTGELHLYHNGRDVGVVWEGLPTADQTLWGFVELLGGWKVEVNYIVPKDDAVTCGEVVCGMMFVSCNICALPQLVRSLHQCAGRPWCCVCVMVGLVNFCLWDSR